MKRDRNDKLVYFHHNNGGSDVGKSSRSERMFSKENGNSFTLFGHKVVTLMVGLEKEEEKKQMVEMVEVEEKKESFDPTLKAIISIENGGGRLDVGAKEKEVEENIKVEEGKGGENEGSKVDGLIENGGTRENTANIEGLESVDVGDDVEWNQELNIENEILGGKVSSDVTLEVVDLNKTKADVVKEGIQNGNVEGVEFGDEMEVQSIEIKNEIKISGWGEWQYEGELKWRKWVNANNPIYWWEIDNNEGAYYQYQWDLQINEEDQPQQEQEEDREHGLWNFYNEDDEDYDAIDDIDNDNDAQNVDPNLKSPET